MAQALRQIVDDHPSAEGRRNARGGEALAGQVQWQRSKPWPRQRSMSTASHAGREGSNRRLQEVRRENGRHRQEAWSNRVRELPCRRREAGQETSFPQAVKLRSDEIVVSSWAVYPSRADRDRANQAIMADEAFKALAKTIPVDRKRMFTGGFKVLRGL